MSSPNCWRSRQTAGKARAAARPFSARQLLLRVGPGEGIAPRRARSRRRAAATGRSRSSRGARRVSAILLVDSPPRSPRSSCAGFGRKTCLRRPTPRRAPKRRRGGFDLPGGCARGACVPRRPGHDVPRRRSSTGSRRSPPRSGSAARAGRKLVHLLRKIGIGTALIARASPHGTSAREGPGPSAPADLSMIFGPIEACPQSSRTPAP